MLHHLKIFQIELPELKQVVGKSLSLRKMLLKTTETAIHRMPPGVNNFSVGENSFDKADIDEIIGHLVSEKGRGAAVTASLLQIRFPSS